MSAVHTPSTAIARCRSGHDGIAVELVDLAGDDEVLARARAALPPGRSAVIEHWDAPAEWRDRLFSALADELRARGRRRATRTFRLVGEEEPTFLASQGFRELRRDDGVATWILDL